MERVVVDSNVFVKWFVEEEYTRESLLIRDDHVGGCIQVTAPAYALLEAGDALRKYVARRLLGPEDALKAIRILSGFEIEFVGIDTGLLGEALEYGLENHVTVYDAYYVVLARRLGAAFYTADEKLLRRIRGIEREAHHVGEYRPRCGGRGGENT